MYAVSALESFLNSFELDVCVGQEDMQTSQTYKDGGHAVMLYTCNDTLLQYLFGQALYGKSALDLPSNCCIIESVSILAHDGLLEVQHMCAPA